MTYTSHGHHIAGTTTSDELGQVARARCGGPRLCSVCSKDASAIMAALDKGVNVAGFFDTPSVPKDDDQKFLDKVKLFVVGARNNVVSDEKDMLTVDDVGICEFYTNNMGWYAKATTNKHSVDGLLFLVTHTINGDSSGTVVETYIKIQYDVFSQEGN